MMDLRDYLKPLTTAETEEFAQRVGTTIHHLRNVAYGTRVASAALAAQIEIASEGKVPVGRLRPKDAHLIWDQRRNHLVSKMEIVGQFAPDATRQQAVSTPAPGP